jgi:hypothetical protein
MSDKYKMQNYLVDSTLTSRTGVFANLNQWKGKTIYVFGEKYGTVARQYTSFLGEILGANVIDFTANDTYISPVGSPYISGQIATAQGYWRQPDLGIIVTGYSDFVQGYDLDESSETTTWVSSGVTTVMTNVLSIITTWLSVYAQSIPLVIVSPLSHVNEHIAVVESNMLDYHTSFLTCPTSNAIFVDGRKAQIDNSNLGTNIYGNGTTLNINGHRRLARFLAKQLCYITN